MRGCTEGGGGQRQQRESRLPRHETGNASAADRDLGQGQHARSAIAHGKDLLMKAFVASPCRPATANPESGPSA